MLNRLSIKKSLSILFISIFISSLIIAYVASKDFYRLSVRRNLLEHSVIKNTKVFQIGFSKCGTATLAGFFNANGIRTIHHQFGHLAFTMYDNYKNNKTLLAPIYQHYIVFTDMENMFYDPPINIGMIMFKEIDKQYPGSKFILNVRDKNAWLKSRSLHPINNRNSTTILELNAEILHTTKEEVLSRWSKEWDDHLRAVKDYFKDRPNDLLVFDIEKDEPQKLVNFFKEDFNLDAKYYKHLNKTSKLRSRRSNLMDRVQIVPKNTQNVSGNTNVR